MAGTQHSAASAIGQPKAVSDRNLQKGMTPMITAAAAAKFVLLFLPFLLSLRSDVAMPKMLCLVTSVLALLLSVEPYAAMLPWSIGMAVATISVRERMYRRQTV
jgi:hypothetical protein